MSDFHMTLETALTIAAMTLSGFNLYVTLKIDHKISLLKIWALNRFQQKRGISVTEDE